MDQPIHRLFFALLPDTTILPQITHAADLARAAGGFRGRGIDASRYHMTLQFIDDFPGTPLVEIERAKAAAATLHIAPFEFVLDHIASFRGSRPPCVLRTAAGSETALRAFWQKLYFALVGAGFSNKLDRRLTPHLTLGYGDKLLPESVPITPLVWQVRELVLIESLVGKSIHNILERWLLLA